MEKQTAAKLYKSTKQSEDITLLMLNVLLVSKDQDVKNIIDFYRQIVSGKLLVADIMSSIELTLEQKSTLEQKLNQKFKDTELVYLYTIDASVDQGISIIVGDNRIQF